MTNKCYSHNEESFYPDLETALERAAENFVEDNEDFEGETEIELFEGEKVSYQASAFLPEISEYLEDRAYGIHDEWSEHWCDKISKNSAEIQKIIGDALDNWANLTNNQPNFFGVENVRSITVKIKVDKEGNWEEIPV